MYSSIQNQLYNLFHYTFAFSLIFILYPMFIFKVTNRSTLENILSRFIKVTMLVIVCVYLLVLIKLYEVLSITLVFFLIFLYKSVGRDFKNKSNNISSRFNVFVLDLLERRVTPKDIVKNRVEIICGRIKDGWINKKSFFLEYLLLFITFIYSAYLRFYDSFHHAALNMADSYVVVAWSKYIGRKELFHDEIYPHGFHICVSMLQKFSFIDPVYVVKYTGPLCTMLITLGIYFFVSRTTGRKSAGILSAIIYGILIQFIPGEWERQAATNSQEFGYIFILPTTYFFYKYLVEDKEEDFYTAFAGFTVTGLVHPIALAFTALGGGVVILVSLITDFKKYNKKVLKTVVAGFTSGIIALSPIALGLVMGKNFKGSSAEFLISKTDSVKAPALILADKIALICLGIIFLDILLNIKKIKHKFIELTTILFSFVAFFLYYYAGVITQSTVVVTRFYGIWQMALPVAIGIGFFTLLNPLKASFSRKSIEIAISMIVLYSCIFYIKPYPIIPYKLERDASVEQYLKIKNMLRPTEWSIVSNIAGKDGGYAIVFGSGWHTRLADFINWFEPEQEYLINKQTLEKEQTPDIFIYHEKNMFTTDVPSIVDELKPTYENRAILNRELESWIEKYKKTHSNISLFYADKNLEIYRIHQEPERTDVLEDIWGKD